jgi:hypothetical protein
VSSFATCEPTPHFTSNCDVIAALTAKRIVARPDGARHVVTL